MIVLKNVTYFWGGRKRHPHNIINILLVERRKPIYTNCFEYQLPTR